MSFEARLAAYLFEPHQWLKAANGNLAVARQMQKEICDVKTFSRSEYESFAGRLLLLNDKEWQLLGLCAVLVPFAGKVKNSMNGRMRRIARAHLAEEKLVSLDRLIADDCQFLLVPDCWDDEEKLIGAGIAAVMASLHWTATQMAVLTARFSESAPAVSGLTPSLVEALCKISLPTHTWLLPETNLA